MRHVAFPRLLCWLVMIMSLALVSCKRPAQQTVVEPEYATYPLQIVTDRGSLLFHVEIARTPDARARGLMFRTELAPDRGMLFLFENEEPLSFYMRNTLIPLDMIFIGADRRIVGIVHRAEPRTLTSRSVGKPSQYVLEINGGLAQKHGIRAGQRVDLSKVPLK